MAYPDTTDEEDFKNRFRPVPLASPAPAEMMNGGTGTLYPPTVLGRNLATGDASLARVNAAGRSTTLPGVGAEGSTPSTDITNLNLAASMERADLAGRTVATPTIAATAMDEFSQRRQEIENQKTQLMAKLGMIPPSAAGFAAVVLPSGQRGRHGEPSEYDKAVGQLHRLDQESQQLRQEEHYSSIENARTAHEDLARRTHIQVSSGLAKVLNGINQINQNYPHGSPEARSAILSLVGSNDPDVAAARGTRSFETLVKPYTTLHDVSAERIKNTVDRSPQAKLNTEMAHYGLTPADLSDIDVGKSDIIPPKGNAGQKMGVVLKDGRQATVPWSDWQRWTSIAKQGSKGAPAQEPAGTVTPPTAAAPIKHLGRYNPATGQFE